MQSVTSLLTWVLLIGAGRRAGLLLNISTVALLLRSGEANFIKTSDRHFVPVPVAGQVESLATRRASAWVVDGLKFPFLVFGGS